MSAKKTLTYIFAIIMASWVLFPFLVAVIFSFQTDADLFKFPPSLIPHTGGRWGPFINYYALMLYWFAGEREYEFRTHYMFPREAMSMLPCMINTIIISSGVVVLTLSIGSLAAYSLSKLHYKGRSMLSTFYLICQLLPTMAVAIPIFYVFYNLNLLDSRYGVILAHSSWLLPFAIWILREYFKMIPDDFEEAAMIDGCSRLGSLFRIVLPLSAPGLIASSIFVFLSSWNEFFITNLITSSDNARTMVLVIASFCTSVDVEYSLMLAGGVIGAIPPLVLAFVFQKYLLQGFTSMAGLKR